MNKVFLSGLAETEPRFNHEVMGERFYYMIISVSRDSGTVDKVPVLVSERLIKGLENLKGKYIHLVGEFRSFNHKGADKVHLVLFLFADELSLADEENKNEIQLDGYICKRPTHRSTPLGRQISDVLLAVNRPYGKADYIPCICWGRNAAFVSHLDVGQHLTISGRIQSREYKKEDQVKTAYEISVSKVTA